MFVSIPLNLSLYSCFVICEDVLEVVGLVSHASSFEEFVLEFDPMETQCVQESFEKIHTHEDSEGTTKENKIKDEKL